MRYKTIDRSMMEEFLAAANLIAGALLWMAGIHWLAWVLFVKAGIDWLCAICFAVTEVANEMKQQKGAADE